VPVALALHLLGKSQSWQFIASCLAIVPLAGWLGRATEHLANHVGQGAGALLNATFGNATELIIALLALHQGLFVVVKASITGSIIGNILLVMGLAFAAGGMKYEEQSFNRTAIRSSNTTLTLAAIALFTPTIFHLGSMQNHGWNPAIAQELSLCIAVVLFLTYIATLVFSLKTHRKLFAGEDCEPGSELDCEEEEEGHPKWSVAKSAAVLLASTLAVALMSEFLVGSVESAKDSLGLTETFVGIIVLAIIGNAAEHSTAVMMALRNKMDLSLGIAIGSSAQVALFVGPVLVFASYAFGKPMNLEFTLPEIAAMIVSILIMGQISGDGKSNWLEGVQLLAVYAVLGILFYFLPEAAANLPH